MNRPSCFTSASKRQLTESRTLATSSTLVSPRGVLSTRSLASLPRSSLLTHPQGSLHPIPQGNLFPIVHVPRRLRPATSELVTFRPPMDLKHLRDDISAKLLAYNADRRAKTDLILKHEKKSGELNKAKTVDTLSERYSPKEHIYTHSLSGIMHIRSVPALVLGQLNQKRTSLVNEEIEQAKGQFPARPPVHLSDYSYPHRDKPWRAFSAVKHLMQLQVPASFIPQLGTIIPHKPLHLPKSRLFLQACKDGDVKLVRSLLRESRWLALSYDYVKQTGIHWAAKRGHAELIPILARSGTFVDSRDCAGRTALFIAARKGNVNEVRELLTLKANPSLRSNAGKSPAMVCKSLVAQRMIEKGTLLAILLKFVPAGNRDKVWEREGLGFFRSDDNEITAAF